MITKAPSGGMLDCSREASLRWLTQLMADTRMHALVVREDDGDRSLLGLVSVPDFVPPAPYGHDAVSADESIGHAAQLMADHGVDHLIITDPPGNTPVAIVYSLGMTSFFGR